LARCSAASSYRTMCARAFRWPGSAPPARSMTAATVRRKECGVTPWMPASARAIRKRRRTLFVSSGVWLRLKKIRCSGSSEAAQGAAQSHADFEAAIVHRPDGRGGPIGT
jgi:hypothetical protein